MQAAIANAQTLAEVERLETALKTGNVPSEVLVRSLCLALPPDLDLEMACLMELRALCSLLGPRVTLHVM